MLRSDACAPISSGRSNFGFLSGAFRNFCVTIARNHFVPNGPPIERERSMENTRDILISAWLACY